MNFKYPRILVAAVASAVIGLGISTALEPNVAPIKPKQPAVVQTTTKSPKPAQGAAKAPEAPVATPVAPKPAAKPAPVKSAPAPAPAGPILGGGGYPAKWANAPQDTILDDWYMYNRECVSYTAWKVSVTWGFQAYGFGDANRWVTAATNRGIPVSATPKVGSVGIAPNAAHGHSVWVESVGAGTVTVSQYNRVNTGLYSVTTEAWSAYTYIYFGDYNGR